VNDPHIWFQHAILNCQRKYFSMLNLRARTDDALYQAISYAYAVYLRVRSNEQVRDVFYQELREKKLRRSRSEALTLIEFAFVPHVLGRRKKGDQYNHKADINKASSYAKVMTYARARKVKSAELVKFIRENGGIQAIADAETKRRSQRTEHTGVRLGRFRPGTAGSLGVPVVKPPRTGDRPLPLALWCTLEVAAKIIEMKDEAYFTDSNRFIIRGRWHDTNNAIVTNFVIAPEFRPTASPPTRPMRGQPAGESTPSRPRGPGTTATGNRPLGKQTTPVGKAQPGKVQPGRAAPLA
jgi:hypothetical protein